jgi:hypothetical protein
VTGCAPHVRFRQCSGRGHTVMDLPNWTFRQGGVPPQCLDSLLNCGVVLVVQRTGMCGRRAVSVRSGLSAASQPPSTRDRQGSRRTDAVAGVREREALLGFFVEVGREWSPLRDGDVAG